MQRRLPIQHASAAGGMPVPERLLHAAETLIAEKGFSLASVREITAAAGCNIAAVNYYFGGKQGLYVEVFRRRLGELRESRIARLREVAAPGRTPVLEDVLRAFADVFLEPFVAGPRGRSFLQLMARELTDPHLPPSMFREELALPVRQVIADTLQRAVPGIEAPSAELCAQSLVAQLAHVLSMWRMSCHGDGPSPAWIREITDHIVRFSAAGVRAYARGAAQ